MQLNANSDSENSESQTYGKPSPPHHTDSANCVINRSGRGNVQVLMLSRWRVSEGDPLHRHNNADARAIGRF